MVSRVSADYEERVAIIGDVRMPRRGNLSVRREKEISEVE